MNLTASHIFNLYRPSLCELRVYLQSKSETESAPSPYMQVLRGLGERHESLHLTSLRDVTDLREGSLSERIPKTKEAVRRKAPVIYQPVFEATANLGAKRTVIGEPDFLIREGQGYVIRDCKISRRITEQDHPEILRQLELYGWLYEQAFGELPVRLEVYSGIGELVSVEFDGGELALALLREIDRIQTLAEEPYSPVGWSKCSGCGFFERCWPIAEASEDVALVYKIDQNLVRTLREHGIISINQLLEHYDETTLAEVKRPWGKKERKVGKDSAIIMRQAKAMAANEIQLCGDFALEPSKSCVMFDIEGLPPQLDEMDKVYLWGLKVFGEQPRPYVCALADFGAEGDLKGWQDFLENCRMIFDEYGDIPFIHWHHYERTRVRTYVKRYGDINGIAARVNTNLKDLLPLTRNSLAIPEPSYSLKVVEKLTGFTRNREGLGGEWAMAKYIEAVETENPQLRDDAMEEIIGYNEEDLDATWALLQWVQSHFRQDV